MNNPTSAKSPSRRSFLKTNAAVTGALMVGVGFGQSDDVIAAGGYADTWVRIAPDGQVTILCGRSEMGQSVATSMPLLVAEELEVPISKVKVEFSPVAAAYGNDFMGGALITGGSTSVRDGYVKLRKAGAATRLVLIDAAAKTWKVPASECTAENATVTHKSGKKLSYAKLAPIANGMPLQKDPPLKPESAFKQIGKEHIRRIDTRDKVNGTATFGIDVKVPGMAIASLAQCPVIGGKVKSYDDSKAKGMPGVYGIYQISDGVGVVARDFYIARKARDAIKIEWDMGPGASVSTEGMKKTLLEAAAKPGVSIRKEGDYDAAAAGAAKKVGGEYWLQMLAHATMEPVNCTASVKDGKCEVIGPIQFQTGAIGMASAIAKTAGVDEKNVSIKTVYLGGGFGRKIELDFIQQSVELAKASGRPVKLIWTREDDIQHDYYRPMSHHAVEGALDASGKLIGLKARMTSASITARAFPPFVQGGVDPFMNEGTHNLDYKLPNLKVDTLIQELGIRVGYWRSVSHALNAFAVESLMDDLAAAAGKNPLEFRMAALEGVPRAQAVLKLVAEKSGWTPGTKSIGLAQMECYETYAAMAVEVDPAKPMSIKKITAVVDCGTAVHPDQVRAQIESGIVLGLAATLYGEITVKDGRVQQSNFHDYQPMRMTDTPPVLVVIANTPSPRVGGMGEVGVPLVAPALANAINAATGKRLRSLPLNIG